uniref:Uncharacterized protein n=1 Tax=Noccaea caerulescens TaxID=107243 RepID=A0A1J3ERN7_NOCCA
MVSSYVNIERKEHEERKESGKTLRKIRRAKKLKKKLMTKKQRRKLRFCCKSSRSAIFLSCHLQCMIPSFSHPSRSKRSKKSVSRIKTTFLLVLWRSGPKYAYALEVL